METMKLEVSQPMLNLIVAALANMPYRDAAPAIKEIERQVQAFNEAQEKHRLLAESANSGQMSAAQENAHREAGEL